VLAPSNPSEASRSAPVNRRVGIRSTQVERSAQTKNKLMRATLALLDADGYARASLADIAQRAGVTRGALHHHFADKDDLVVQSAGLLLAESTAEIEVLARDVSEGRLTLDSFLDHLWQMFRGPLFMITLEYVTESRHNAALKAGLAPLAKQFHASLNVIWQRFFQAHGVDADTATVALNATLCLLRGMSAQTVLRDDEVYYSGLIIHWKRHLHQLLDSASTPADHRRHPSSSRRS
jgi:AcrR family transcriptional regulator